MHEYESISVVERNEAWSEALTIILYQEEEEEEFGFVEASSQPTFPSTHPHDNAFISQP